jgi:hypothetical protein
MVGDVRVRVCRTGGGGGGAQCVKLHVREQHTVVQVREIRESLRLLDARSHGHRSPATAGWWPTR